MNVRIDESGKEMQARRVHDLLGLTLQFGPDRYKSPVRNGDVRRNQPFARHDCPAPEQKIVRTHINSHERRNSTVT